MDWNMNGSMNNMGMNNYSGNSMPQQPMYNGVQNPLNYEQRMNAQRPQQVSPNYILGRIVNSEKDVIPKEVPMDGSFGTFVQNDLKKVYLKTWGGDGQIHTNEYELVSSDGIAASNNTQNTMELILERLDRIEAQLKGERASTYPRKEKKPYVPKNKEVEEHE